MKHIFLSAFVFAALSGCNSWVRVTDEGETVREATASQVRNCRRIGRAHASTMSRFVFVERGGERMQEELLRLARNEAGDMGGNTIVPESVIEEGEQTFGVYICPN